MKEAVAKKWVKALRSGKYRKITGRLHGPKVGDGEGFCALGVLCDISHRGKWDDREYVTGLLRKESSSGSILSPGMTKWSGLTSTGSGTIASMNDNKVPKASFHKIAAYIEKNWATL